MTRALEKTEKNHIIISQVYSQFDTGNQNA